jgi:hypothetical protein
MVESDGRKRTSNFGSESRLLRNKRTGQSRRESSFAAHPTADVTPTVSLFGTLTDRRCYEDFQLALFDPQSDTGLPIPLGTAIKTNPKLLKELAFVPAEGPAPVYTSI